MNKSETIKQFMDFNPYLNDENKNRLLNHHSSKLNVLKIQHYLNKALELKQKGVNNQDIVKLLSENNYDWYQYYLHGLNSFSDIFIQHKPLNNYHFDKETIFDILDINHFAHQNKQWFTDNRLNQLDDINEIKKQIINEFPAINYIHVMVKHPYWVVFKNIFKSFYYLKSLKYPKSGDIADIAVVAHIFNLFLLISILCALPVYNIVWGILITPMFLFLLLFLTGHKIENLALYQMSKDSIIDECFHVCDIIENDEISQRHYFACKNGFSGSLLFGRLRFFKKDKLVADYQIIKPLIEKLELPNVQYFAHSQKELQELVNDVMALYDHNHSLPSLEHFNIDKLLDEQLKEYKNQQLKKLM